MKGGKRYPINEAITLLLFWAYVAIPLSWGVYSTIKKASALFH